MIKLLIALCHRKFHKNSDSHELHESLAHCNRDCLHTHQPETPQVTVDPASLVCGFVCHSVYTS